MIGLISCIASSLLDTGNYVVNFQSPIKKVWWGWLLEKS